MPHNDTDTFSRRASDRNSHEYSKDKAALLAWLFSVLTTISIGVGGWLFTRVIDLEKRVIRLETIHEQSAQPRNYGNVK